MLEQLNTIDWSKLQHAYGDASDVPNLIRALASDDAEKRQEAYWDLNGNIIHQGSIYEAAAYAVPFFIELLQGKNIFDKHRILQLLSSLARGGSWHQSHQHFDWLFRKEREKPEFQEKIRYEVNHVTATYDAVISGYQTYLLLLQHPDSDVREHAAGVLSNCGPHLKEIEPVLLRLVDEEQKLKLRKSYLLSLKNLWQHPDFYTYSRNLAEAQHQYLINLFHHSDILVLRYAAAIALAETAGSDLNQKIVLLFDEIMKLPDSEREAIDYNIHDAMRDVRRDNPDIAYQFLKKHLHHPDEEIQIRIIYQFEYFGTALRKYTEEIANLLASLLKSGNDRVRMRAAQVLGVMGQFAKPYLADLEEILEDNTIVGRTGAKRALKEVRDNNWSAVFGVRATRTNRWYKLEETFITHCRS